MKKELTIIAASLVLCLQVVAQSQDEARLLRFPATNSSEIVFSYGGDLYTVSADGG